MKSNYDDDYILRLEKGEVPEEERLKVISEMLIDLAKEIGVLRKVAIQIKGGR